MMSRQVVTAALVFGLLVTASPVAAQRQRHPGGGGESRGGGQNAGGGRQVASAPVRGGRAPYVAPPQAAGQRGRSETGRYAVPREQADGGRAYANRGYADRGYADRGYTGRYVDPGPGVRRGYAAPRSYAVPRGYVAPRGGYGGGGYYRGSRGYYGPPRYVAPGWRGSRGNRYVVVTPRYVSPYILGYGAWQPYYYRPSIGLGMYYGADGLYPFGAIPPVYYNPSPGAAYGGLRITDAPRDAQVFADGNYVGIVDDFDGVFQHLNLEPGQHRVEIHAPGLTPIAFDVVVQPGRTITLRADIY